MSRKLTRRELLVSAAGLAAVATAGVQCSSDDAAEDGQAAGDRPDMLILLTDQERHHVHWPDGMLEKLMPSWARLAALGVTFDRAYCAASQCSPSRACLWTGRYAAENGVPYLDQGKVLPTKTKLPSIATVLRQAGYDVIYKGKWHLSYPEGFTGTKPTDEVWTEADADVLRDDYGFFEWNPPESGHSAFNSVEAQRSWGGGNANNDGRTVAGVSSALQTPGFGESVLDFVARVGAIPRTQRAPFCLIVNLVNPHDIAFFPDGYDEGGYRLEDFESLGIALPPNHDDPLDTKPSIQLAFRDKFQGKVAIDDDPVAQARYVNFYAYLHGVVESHIQQVLDAFDQHGLSENTVIVRTADHGEMGLSHGLREKAYNAYEETIHVPLVIAFPGRFPAGATTSSFWSHVDLVATLAELAGAPAVGVGKSQVSVLKNPEVAARDDVLFAYDDNFIYDADELPGSHIRALRENRYTYAVYFSADGSQIEFELYDNGVDAGQMNNLLHQPAAGVTPLWNDLHAKLTARMQDASMVPAGFAWPKDPTTA